MVGVGQKPQELWLNIVLIISYVKKEASKMEASFLLRSVFYKSLVFNKNNIRRGYLRSHIIVVG